VSHPSEEEQQVEQTISEEILRIHNESYGRGAAQARTYILENDVVCFLDEIELLPNEEFLVDNGHRHGGKCPIEVPAGDRSHLSGSRRAGHRPPRDRLFQPYQPGGEFRL
jgi:Na+-translocating membrane potential-generating system MpsC-like protein